LDMPPWAFSFLRSAFDIAASKFSGLCSSRALCFEFDDPLVRGFSRGTEALMSTAHSERDQHRRPCQGHWHSVRKQKQSMVTSFASPPSPPPAPKFSTATARL
jgi:hypothetical protein